MSSCRLRPIPHLAVVLADEMDVAGAVAVAAKQTMVEPPGAAAAASLYQPHLMVTANVVCAARPCSASSTPTNHCNNHCFNLSFRWE